MIITVFLIFILLRPGAETEPVLAAPDSFWWLPRSSCDDRPCSPAGGTHEALLQGAAPQICCRFYILSHSKQWRNQGGTALAGDKIIIDLPIAFICVWCLVGMVQIMIQVTTHGHILLREEVIELVNVGALVDMKVESFLLQEFDTELDFSNKVG